MTDGGRYALKTEVGSEATRIEIERTLKRYGATQFLSGWAGNSAIVGFRVGERQYRFTVPLPDPDADEFRYGAVNQHGGVRERPTRARDRMYEQRIRSRWRALLLVVKAKLEAVDVGIFSLEEAFMAETLLPDGQTVSEWAEPQVEQVYSSGGMPPALPGFRPALPGGKR